MVTLRALKQRLDKRSKSNGDNHSSLLWSSVNGASTLSIITFSIMIKYDTHRNDTRHNCTEHCYAESFMLSVIYAECRMLALYAECHYGECLSAECRGAM